ncbi:MAG: 4-hydroxy-tetrahydrodipicolinate reductase [Bacteroidales bacterium]|nr:4-hydroxy-tetrahydrodipicolinate reductase [Bacteroidales bacterium]
MNIAIIGYGKMGKVIEAEAAARGMKVAATVDNDDDWAVKSDALRQCDVAIEFSTPDTAVTNIRRCFDMDLPVVVGTTGWYDRLDAVVDECRNRNQALFVASNFSIGMNIMFILNRHLAQLMDRYDDYSVSIAETHHIHKLDAPSGTAITLANDIIDNVGRLDEWHLVRDPRDPDAADTKQGVKSSLPVESYREGEVPGTHTVTYDSPVDTITLIHSAKSRKGLAVGALLAAQFLVGKKGYYTMNDLLS